MTWTVQVDASVAKALRRLWRGGRRDVVQRVERAMETVRTDPMAPRPGADIARLHGAGSGAFRLRVGEYRLLYELDIRRRAIRFTALVQRERAYR